uniref:ZM domain-containing protein n=1 Tax=Panagrellus redivivus TaxID=6233 RepID=A0A7E4UXM3_PANRE
MASTSVPPAPPPPPPLQQPAKTLAVRQRAPANREHVGGVRAAGNTPNRSPLANIHPETLQHAAANLRKTQYREPLLSFEPEQLLGRSDQLPAAGYRPSDPELRPLGVDRSGATLHAANPHSDASAPSSELRGYSLPLGGTAGNPGSNARPWASSTIASTATLPKLGSGYVSPLLSGNNNNKVSSYSSSTTYNYPSNVNVNSVNAPGYYSSSSTTTTLNSVNNLPTGNGKLTSEIAPPDYPPPPPPSVPPPTSATRVSPNGANSYLSNPQSYIHQYATQTPVGTFNNGTSNINGASETTTNVRSKTPKAYNFAEELRDSTLTSRQKYANQFQQSNLPERLPPEAVAQIYNETTAPTQKRLFETPRQTPTKSTATAYEVDELIKDMESQLRNASASPTNVRDYDTYGSYGRKVDNVSPGGRGGASGYTKTTTTTTTNNNFSSNVYKHLGGLPFYIEKFNNSA